MFKDAVHQKWSWDGLMAESIIYLAEDVLNLTNYQIIELSAKTGLIKSGEPTLTRKYDLKYIFVNFNFNY